MTHPEFGKRRPQPGVWERSPQPPEAKEIWGRASSRHEFLQKNTHFSLFFLSKKDTRVPLSGFNPPLLALLVDLRYSISIFVCRLLVTENISGGGLLS